MEVLMAKSKTTGFFFKMSPDESELFERRMAQTGIHNKSAFIRKMCIDGHVIDNISPRKTVINFSRITAMRSLSTKRRKIILTN